MSHPSFGYMLAARRAFAALNGWSYTERSFTTATLARGGAHDGSLTVDKWRSDMPLAKFDHREFFKLGRRAVCIMGHQYDNGSELLEWVGSRTDLVAHVPAAGKAASWYLPGGTLPVAVTRPGVHVQWPSPGLMAAFHVDHELAWASNGGH